MIARWCMVCVLCVMLLCWRVFCLLNVYVRVDCDLMRVCVSCCDLMCDMVWRGSCVVAAVVCAVCQYGCVFCLWGIVWCYIMSSVLFCVCVRLAVVCVCELVCDAVV